jgi:hypothetical protein
VALSAPFHRVIRIVDHIAIVDAEEKDALARKRAAMLDEMPYSN